MGMEIENPQSFLDEAKKAVAEYQDVVAQLSKMKDMEKTTASALDKARKEIQDKIEKTLKQRSDDLTATYDKQISQVEVRLKKKQAERDKAKKEGVKGRIKNETEPRRIENKELRRQIAAVMKKDNAPAFYSTDVFYTLFHPSGLGELMTFLMVFIIIFALLPFGVYFLIPDHKFWYLFVIYLVDILIFGGIYVCIMNISGRHADAIRQGRDIKNRIKTNRKIISKMEKTIRKDSSEAGYNLEAFDDEIAKMQQERSDIISQKQSAQNTFDTVTRNIIIDEIETASKPRIDELSQAFTSAMNQRSGLETRERELALNLTKTYEQYLGKAHMNAEDIDRIKALMANQEASSVIDAVTRLDHPSQDTTAAG
ncbi:hypothetical protein [Oribacterium sp. WCC10]|uniref:hypothetical protein n=1 Tax=Oribacterium sp. WCC10 TaxID=1855343 RepID=UPI0008EA9DE7|nr:hypothetical protein [Oribacterium sp. WCC10]SFG14776.1 hypothetical protein SAMN05216356_102148 [Oribacterium sp. WCC10]